MALADEFVVYDGVQYEPKGFDNRNRIRTADGSIWLTVPVLKKGHRGMPIEQIEINEARPWRRKHWRSISTSYASAPFFSRYADFFEDLYARTWPTLVELNVHILRWLVAELGMTRSLQSASKLDLVETGSARVLEMCRKLGADRYIFGEHGRSYADLDAFIEADIEVFFQEYRHPEYRQVHDGEFVPNLSVIDLLFNHGERSLDIIMSGNLQSLYPTEK
jgi:hypothetical protein